MLFEFYVFCDGKEKKVIDFNGWIKEYSFLKLEYFKVKVSDGVEIDVWIMKLVNFELGKKYLVVLEIYGGLKMVYGYVFMYEFYVLIVKGFVVIFFNLRGSDGYGEEFVDIRGYYGECDY